MQTLLLIVEIYLSIAFTLFLITLRVKDIEADKMKKDMAERDGKLDKILELLQKIGNHSTYDSTEPIIELEQTTKKHFTAQL